MLVASPLSSLCVSVFRIYLEIISLHFLCLFDLYSQALFLYFLPPLPYYFSTFVLISVIFFFLYLFSEFCKCARLFSLLTISSLPQPGDPCPPPIPSTLGFSDHSVLALLVYSSSGKISLIPYFLPAVTRGLANLWSSTQAHLAYSHGFVRLLQVDSVEAPPTQPI